MTYSQTADSETLPLDNFSVFGNTATLTGPQVRWSLAASDDSLSASYGARNANGDLTDAYRLSQHAVFRIEDSGELSSANADAHVPAEFFSALLRTGDWTLSDTVESATKTNFSLGNQGDYLDPLALVRTFVEFDVVDFGNLTRTGNTVTISERSRVDDNEVVQSDGIGEFLLEMSGAISVANNAIQGSSRVTEAPVYQLDISGARTLMASNDDLNLTLDVLNNSLIEASRAAGIEVADNTNLLEIG